MALGRQPCCAQERGSSPTRRPHGLEHMLCTCLGCSVGPALGQLLGPSDSEACPPGPVWLCVEPIGWVPEKSWPALTSRSGGARPPHASRPALTSRSGGAGPLMPAGDVSSGSSKTVLS